MKAIVYTSCTGHTAEYARILADKAGLPVYSSKEASRTLAKDTKIIYLGWLFANGIKGYKKAVKRYKISAICSVGLCDTGSAIEEIRKSNNIPEEIPIFTMQGGIDKSKLRGINKLMINMLTRALAAQSERTENDEHMLRLLTDDRSYVSEENTAAFMRWYQSRAEVTD